MPKRKTIFGENVYYHAFNRGFKKQHIFKVPKDKERFMEKAMFYADKFNVAIESSAILINHYHFLLKQRSKGDVQQFLSRIQLSYARYYNVKYQRRGPVFDSRFHAKPIQDQWQYVNGLNYILKNPWKHTLTPGSKNFNL